MKIVREINPHIFRGYDIRGIYGEDLTEDVIYTIGLGFGSYIQDLGKSKVIVGMDNRASSKSLKEALIEGVTSTGVDVVDIGLCTTPMYYFAWEHLNIPSGLMITASHNPKEYNGLKFAFDERGNAYGEYIQEFREYILTAEFKVGKGTVTKVDILREYIERLCSGVDFGARALKVVVDPGNGTASDFVKPIFSKFKNLDVTYICDKSDANFPNHHPDPSVEKNLEMLKKAVLETGADVGLGLDGDADRVGIITETGEFMPPDHYMIAISRDILSKDKNSKILFDVKCTKALADEIERLGGSYERYRVGNSYLKARMKEGEFAFGGEFSGHIFFRDKWSGFDDGIYAGLRFLEILSHTDKKASELEDGINKYYSSVEIKIKTTEDKKYDLVKKVEDHAKLKGYNINKIDGVRVEEPNFWVLVRASQTGPDVTLRCEATTEEKLTELIEEFEKVLKE